VVLQFPFKRWRQKGQLLPVCGGLARIGMEGRARSCRYAIFGNHLRGITMKQRILAASIMAAAGIYALPASAQSSVTIYGLIDTGYVIETGGAAGKVNKLTSGISGGSRIGFKGTEDLGGGMSAVFLLSRASRTIPVHWGRAVCCSVAKAMSASMAAWVRCWWDVSTHRNT
jgi:hypothetical protein